MNGDNEKEEMKSLEMETLNPSGRTVSAPQRPPSLVVQIVVLLRMYIEYYPKLGGFLFVCVFMGSFMLALDTLHAPVRRNQMEQDFLDLKMSYYYNASQINHWCLFGGDLDCPCEDFSDPTNREEIDGWLEAHKVNSRMAADTAWDDMLDVVFVGDETAEAFGTGKRLGRETSESARIRSYWNKTFGGTALSLGVAGDSTSNLLWRLEHGEIPPTLNAKVWWLLIGGNDLDRGGCSEEAVTLGVLRVAEELQLKHPGSIVVIQGLLPRSRRKDGSLEPKSKSIFKGLTEHERIEAARKQSLLWPSIQHINNQLRSFGENHPTIVYFDIDKLFVTGQVGSNRVQPGMMEDYIHLTYEGHKKLADTMKEEVDRIVLDENYENEIET